MTNRLANLLATACLLTFVFGFGAISGPLPSAAAQSEGAPTEGAASLRGLKAVAVLVEDVPGGTGLRGLTGKSIQADVEQRLRQAGFRVVTAEESYRLPGAPFLHVQVSLADHARAASVEVELDQGALLTRNGEVIPNVITWQRSTLLSKPTGEGVRNAVKERVDAFVDAWLAANPRLTS